MNQNFPQIIIFFLQILLNLIMIDKIMYLICVRKCQYFHSLLTFNALIDDYVMYI